MTYIWRANNSTLQTPQVQFNASGKKKKFKPVNFTNNDISLFSIDIAQLGLQLVILLCFSRMRRKSMAHCSIECRDKAGVPPIKRCSVDAEHIIRFQMWTENFCSIFAPKVAFSNLSGIVWTRPWYTHLPKGSCLHQGNTRGNWDIPLSTIRKCCITSTYSS